MIIKKKISDAVLLMQNLAEFETISLGIWVKCGSIFENNKLNGISHFIEHMVFKGTGNRSARDIAEELDLIGGQVNAFSAKEYTCFYGRVTTRNLEQAVDILFDIVLNPAFKEEDFVKEKNVILEEIKMYEDTPDEIIHDLLPLHIFHDSSLKLPILGSPDSLSGITLADLENYYRKNYVSSNMIISVCGKINCDQIESLIRPRIEAAAGKIRKRTPGKGGGSFCNGAWHKEKNIEQCHLLIGFPGISQLDRRLYSLNLLNNVLDGSMSSRIFQKIREDMGQAYSTYSYLLNYMNQGLYAIYAACDPKNIPAVTESIWNEINKLKKEGITDRELQISKNQYISSLYLSMESTYNRMLRMAKYEFYYSRNIPLSEVVSRIEEIDRDDLLKAADDILSEEKSFMVTVGAKSGG
ncbi:MAG: pitrilysin family protein [Candidatus Wallbacteria bacterium]|nr:pitrilysin family protein [Candidatus Wallbacteria bacterium]